MKRSGVRRSVCPSVPPFARSCGGFAAERRAGRRYRSTAAAVGRPAAIAPQNGAQQQIALSSKCEQCHVVSRRRKLNTELSFPAAVS